MAEIVEFELVAKTSGAVDAVNKVDEAVKKTTKATKKASKELSGMQQVGNEAVKGLDKITGGLASKFAAVGKAAKLSGKAMKTALISSGIGLAVVAVGLLVEYWDEIGEALGFINKDLERQIELNNQNLDAVGLRLRNIQTLIELRKREGKDVNLLLKKEKELTEQKKQALITSIQDQAVLLNRLKLKQQEGKLNEEDTKELIKQEGVYLDLINNFNKFKSDLLEPVKEVVKKDTSVEDAKKAADKAKKIAEELEKARIDAIERIRKGLIDTEAEERAEKLRLIKEDYDQQIQLAAEFYGTNSIKILELKAAQKLAEDEQQALFDEKDKEREEKIAADEKAKEDKRIADIKENAEKEIKINEAINQQKADLVDANLNTVASGFALLGQLAGKNKGLQAAAIIGESAVGIAKSVIDTTASNIAITAQGAALAIPSGGTSVTAATALVSANNIMSGIGIAANIASTGKALSALKAGGGAPSPTSTNVGGGSGGAPIPPEFNVVGQSDTNQLADAIGGQAQRPARAFVVSNDVTTAQELDRNIIEGASIG